MPQERGVTALFWILRIGEGIRISQINRNSQRTWSVVRTLEGMGLVRVERLGRLKVVRLTEKGERVRLKLLEALRELDELSQAFARVDAIEACEPVSSELPEWLRSNPWLNVMGERGRI